MTVPRVPVLDGLIARMQAWAGPLALAVAALYGIGFLVVNFHLGRYGVSELELLRGRYVAAAALFLAFAASGAYVGSSLARALSSNFRAARGLFGWIGAIGRPLVAFVGFVLVEGAFLGIVGKRTEVLGPFRDLPSYYIALVAWNALVAMLYGLVWQWRRLSVATLDIVRNQAWQLAIQASLVLTLYVSAIYPSLPPWLGGGLPDQVQIAVDTPTEAICPECASGVFLLDQDGYRIIVLIPDGTDKFRALELARSHVIGIRHLK